MLNNPTKSGMSVIFLGSGCNLVAAPHPAHGYSHHEKGTSVNSLETPARWSRTAAVLGTGALAVAIALGGPVATASADSPVTDFGSISFSVTNAGDNTIYDINAILNLPPGTLPLSS